MISRFLAYFANIIYFVPFWTKQYRKQFPDEQIVISEATKAIQLHTEIPVSLGFHRLKARRRVFILTNKKITCGNWVLPIEKINDATLFDIGNGYVLQVKINDHEFYQFGLAKNASWQTQNILDVKYEKISLKGSIFFQLIRFTVFGYVLYVFFKDLVKLIP